LLWAGLGIVRGLEATFDTVWQVRGRGMRVKLFGLLWLTGAGLILVGSIALTALLSHLPPFFGVLSLLLALVVNFALWLWTFKTLTNRPLPLSAHVSGAVVGAIGLLVLSAVGAYYVPRAVASASALYGTLGVVLALLAWFLLLGRLVVYAATINVIRWESIYGTVTVEVALPRMPGNVPISASRAGEELPTGDT
jgi:uncharacterized BrkB/YihY/UPF0761 family membrane protein